MEHRSPAQEDLLQAWMGMSAFIRGNRLLTDFSFNEIMVCGLLFRCQESGSEPLTATDLSEQTNLLKSQINHILTAMEERGLIRRVRSHRDRRVVHVHLLEAGRTSYLQEHTRVMNIIQAVFDTLGYDNAKTLTALINQATEAVNAYQKGDS